MRHNRRLIPAAPHNFASPGGSSQINQNFVDGSLGKNEAGTSAAEFAVQGDETVVQPPTGGRSNRPVTLLVCGPDEHRYDRAPTLECRPQGLIVLQAQVAAKPEENW